MKCYNHHNVDAVGLCKNCGKGLCPTCLVDVNPGLACKDTCVSIVEATNVLISRNIAATQNQRSTFSANIIFMIGLGLLFLFLGIFTSIPPLRLFLLPAGVLFTVLGSYNIWLSRRILRRE